MTNNKQHVWLITGASTGFDREWATDLSPEELRAQAATGKQPAAEGATK